MLLFDRLVRDCATSGRRAWAGRGGLLDSSSVGDVELSVTHALACYSRSTTVKTNDEVQYLESW